MKGTNPNNKEFYELLLEDKDEAFAIMEAMHNDLGSVQVLYNDHYAHCVNCVISLTEVYRIKPLTPQQQLEEEKKRVLAEIKEISGECVFTHVGVVDNLINSIKIED